MLLNDYLRTYIARLQEGKEDSLIPLLPLFSIDGEPMDLSYHYQFAPIFKLNMPKRFVLCAARQTGKSYSLTARNILLASTLPGFHILFVQPRCDQIDRFTQSIVKPMLNNFMLKDLVTNSACSQNTRIKEFISGSSMFFEYAFLNPDRTRGISGSASICWDESLSYRTLCSFKDTKGNIGIKELYKISAGDYLTSFSSNGNVITSKVIKDASYHGIRNCFKVTLESGHELICTADHRLPTSIGNVRLSEIIEHEFTRRELSLDDSTTNKGSHTRAIGDTGTDGVRDSTRRRVYCDNHLRKRGVSGTAWVEAARVQLDQVPDITRIRYETTREETELRLRRMVEYMAVEKSFNIWCFTHPAISGKPEDRDTGVVGSIDAGRDSLVGDGRRISPRGPQVNNIHPRLYGAGSKSDINLAREKIQYKYDSLQGLQEQHEQHLFCTGLSDKINQDDDRPDKTFHTGMHGLQSGLGTASLQTVWPGVIHQKWHTLLGGMSSPVLEDLSETVLCSPQRGNESQVGRMEEGPQGTAKGAEENKLLQESGTEPTEQKGVCQGVPKEVQGKSAGEKASLETACKGYPGIQGTGSEGADPLLCQVESRPNKMAAEVGESKYLSQVATQACQGERKSESLEISPSGAVCQTAPSFGSQENGEMSCRSGIQEETERTETGSISQAAPCSGSDRELLVLWEGAFQQAENSMLISGLYKEGQEREADKISCPDSLRPSRIASIEYYGPEPVYDIEVEGTHSYILADGFASYNCQDLNHEFLEIIAECASASKRYGFFMYTGTPKTSDGTLTTCWEESSMAEWVIPCQRCKKLNIASLKQDLIRMIGRKTCCCAKCGKPIDTASGHYEHLFPDRRSTYAGYHISQVVHPLHCTIPAKWRDLLYKMDHYSTGRFYNEVLGEACDLSVKLLGLADLKNASNGFNCKLAEAVAKVPAYETTVIGVDWSGGGELSHSYTAIAVCGIKPGSDQIDCIYAERLPHGQRPEDEAKFILQLMHLFHCSFIAHDFTGAGYLREVLLAQAGVPPGQIMPLSYCVMANKDILVWNPPSATGRYFYSLDKPRSLVVMCQMIKRQKITLPEYDSAPTILSDLLALTEDPKEIARGNIIYLINKKPKTSDDFAHALNFACSAIWHAKASYPDMAEAEKFRNPNELLQLADPNKVNWR